MIQLFALIVASAPALSLRASAGVTIPISTSIETTTPSAAGSWNEQVDASWNLHLEALALLALSPRWRLGVGAGIDPTVRRERNLEAAGFQTIPVFLGGELVAWTYGDAQLVPWSHIGWTLAQPTMETTRNADLSGGLFYAGGLALEKSFWRLSAGLMSSSIEIETNGPYGKQSSLWEMDRISVAYGVTWP